MEKYLLAFESLLSFGWLQDIWNKWLENENDKTIKTYVALSLAILSWWILCLCLGKMGPLLQPWYRAINMKQLVLKWHGITSISQAAAERHLFEISMNSKRLTTNNGIMPDAKFNVCGYWYWIFTFRFSKDSLKIKSFVTCGVSI